jgi:hypothetical protein
MEWRLESIVVPRTNPSPLSITVFPRKKPDSGHQTPLWQTALYIFNQIGYMNKLFDYVSDSVYSIFLLLVQIFYRPSFTVANLKLVNCDRGNQGI